jgi:YidC/Oxa1 family membrane protein insertase
MNQESLTMLYSFIHRPDSINTIFLGYFNLAQPERYILPILTGASQFIQTRMTMPKVAGQADNAQMAISKQMIYFLPIMTVVIAMSLPSALPLYWLVTTLLAILQQYLINKSPSPVKKVRVTTRKK